jgi:N-hydroxyarylamine O-acetyltransferase
LPVGGVGDGAAVVHIYGVSYSPDLEAYFARIGYHGTRAPTVATLHAISLAHVQAIPFEALDVLLGRGVDLDPLAVERKLVHGGRGGYCFEQNSLLLHVLVALGYEAKPISARVRQGRPRDYTPARTHVFVRVELDGESWLVDVGVGGLSLTSAIRLAVDIEQETAHEPRRLVAEGRWDGLAARGPEGRLFHQARLGGEWVDVCELTLEEMPEIDRVVGNWYTSTHPRSHFKERLVVGRATATGRSVLVNRELVRRRRDGSADKHLIATPEELLQVLSTEFSLHFPADTRFVCPGLEWP